MCNPFIVQTIKNKKKLKYKKAILLRNKLRQIQGQDSNGDFSKQDDPKSNFSLPNNALNRVGRWTNYELSKLKLSMAIFGD